MCQISKSRIKVKIKLIVCADAQKAARLTANNCRYATADIIGNNNDKSNNNYINVDLAKFGINTKTLLADNIRKTCCRWAVNDYTNSSKINVITKLIINLKYEISTH